jgi:hypothetical protein
MCSTPNYPCMNSACLACCSARLSRLSYLPWQMSRCSGCTCRCAWSPGQPGVQAVVGFIQRPQPLLQQAQAAERACPACMASRGGSQGTMSSAGRQSAGSTRLAWEVQSRVWEGRGSPRQRRASRLAEGGPGAGAEQRACCAMQRQPSPAHGPGPLPRVGRAGRPSEVRWAAPDTHSGTILH